MLAPARYIGPVAEETDGHLALTGFRGRLRLLRGMVHANRPWRLMPHLASATAAAATAAFGIFYSSIWTMAEALPLWRLAVINVVAIAAMVAWLIAYNHLWDRPSWHRDPGQAVIYNASTVLALTIGVTCMYAMLYVLALLAAGAVIDTGYLRSKVGHPVGAGDYATSCGWPARWASSPGRWAPASTARTPCAGPPTAAVNDSAKPGTAPRQSPSILLLAREQ